MRKKLIIFSGSSDCNSQIARYEVLKQYASKLEYLNVEIISYPGQKSNDEMKSELSFVTSVEVSLERLYNAEEAGIPYDIISLSYGCNVFLDAIQKVVLKNVERISLWGATSQITYYSMLVKDREKTYKNGIDKYHVKYGSNIYHELPSFEVQLAAYNQNHKLYIGSGKNDTVTSPAYLEYLSFCFIESPEFEFQSIENIGHIVIEPNEAYLKFLFGQ